jgi:hypothetical protein
LAVTSRRLACPRRRQASTPNGSQDKRNTWTFGDPNVKGEPFKFPIIGRANVTDTRGPLHRSQRCSSLPTSMSAISPRAARKSTARCPSTARARCAASPSRCTGAILSPNSTVTFGKTNFEMHAKSGATYLDLNGVLPAATQIEGSDLNLKVRGPNIRLLFDFLGAAAPDTRAYVFTSKLTKVGGEWRFTHINGRYGASDLHGAMTISFPKERLFIDATLNSNLVDIIDVGPFIGYAPASAGDGRTAGCGRADRRHAPHSA